MSEFPVPREAVSFGGWNDSKFGVGDITGRGSIEFWSQAKKMDHEVEQGSREPTGCLIGVAAPPTREGRKQFVRLYECGSFRNVYRDFVFENPFLLSSAPRPSRSPTSPVLSRRDGAGVVTKTIGLHPVVNVYGAKAKFIAHHSGKTHNVSMKKRPGAALHLRGTGSSSPSKDVGVVGAADSPHQGSVSEQGTDRLDHGGIR